MLTDRSHTLTARIKRHYNLLALFYYGLWGAHVHHGYWDDEADTASPRAAQERLIAELYRFGGSPLPRRMLDIGCGVGGSLLWFARHLQATGSGMTLSRMQQVIGRMAFLAAGMSSRLTIRVADAQKRWPVDDASVNLVWCVECSEHLRDRMHFMRESYRVLAPGGTLCLAAWLAGPDASPAAVARRRRVQNGMLCHPFGTAAEYGKWCADAGFTGVFDKIVTSHVIRTWDLCIALRNRPGLPWLARHLGRDVQAFTEVFQELRQAYIDGAMAYGFFVARKPLDDGGDIGG